MGKEQAEKTEKQQKPNKVKEIIKELLQITLGVIFLYIICMLGISMKEVMTPDIEVIDINGDAYIAYKGKTTALLDSSGNVVKYNEYNKNEHSFEVMQFTINETKGKKLNMIYDGKTDTLYIIYNNSNIELIDNNKETQ